MATLIKADGTLQVVHPRSGIGTTFSLEELQGYVGGWIEMIRPVENEIAVVNEEGRILKLPPNPRASLATGYYLVGDVLICEDAELE